LPAPESIRETFCALLESAFDQRGDLLARLPADVRAEVVSLLEAHAAAGPFLTDSEEGPFQSNACLGPYLILEKLGQGGMGVVYRARRDDGEFHREVAIKVVGGRLFAPEAERRFIAERRILALLDHPHIVHMIDGGVWQGHRYLVMELVEGLPVTEFCTAHSLPLADKLRLLQAICSAIHYAHQRLIIHRDLKAGNILVTAEGQVKVLDFGIARLLEAGDAGDASTTVLHPMSLFCASPEQVRGERLTLATDIYSLGLLLYELLTGVNPQSTGAHNELIRRIAEEDPLPPRKLAPGVSRDLEAIALKALAKDPALRYASAEEMSADIGRFLDNRPVLARTPSRLYNAARFCARNKALTATAIALGVVMGMGFAVSTWEARRAGQQSLMAQRRFDEARRLINTIIREIEPKLANINGTVSVRATLIEQTLGYLEALAKDANDNPALQREVIGAYIQLADVIANPGASSLGNPQRAGQIYEKADALAEALLRKEPRNPDSLRTAIGLYRSESRYQFNYGTQPRAEAYARRALDTAERLSNSTPEDPQSQDDVALAASALGGVVRDQSQRIGLFERSRSIWRKTLTSQPQNASRLRRNIAVMCRNLSTAWIDEENYPKALDLAAEAQELDEGLLAGSPSAPSAQMDLAFDLGAMALAYEGMRDFRRAVESQHRNVVLREKVAAANPDDFRAADRLAYGLNYLAHCERLHGESAPAERDDWRAVNLYGELRRRGTLVPQSLKIYAKSLGELILIPKGKGRAGACDSLAKTLTDVLAEFQRRATPTARDLQDLNVAREAIRSCEQATLSGY
jgi:tetratricopeptide (TPR) repeat protein